MTTRFVLIALILLALAGYGCSSKVADDRQEKEEQLAAYQAERDALQKKIAELESELSNEAEKGMVNVSLSRVKEERFENFIEVMGMVQSDKNLMVSPETSGNIIEILVKEGDRVNKGAVLARLNTDALDRSIQELEVNLNLAQTMFERQELLWNQSIGSEVQYLQAKSEKEALARKLEGLKAQRAMSVITSPISGVVDDLLQRKGEMAAPSIPFARIVNLDQIYIIGDVAEVYLNKIEEGDSVQIEFPVLDLTVPEVITRTSSVLDADSRTFRIRVDMMNRNQKILPNLMAVFRLQTYERPNAIVVPSILVKKDFDGEFLFVADANEENQDVARKRYITSTINDNNQTVIDSGLKPGDRIITEGYAQVTDGALLNISEVN
ncbi:efflux RND transporter periplasmic adaptor subunit [Geofilum rubicundum]|uniref:Probable Co/Zn/Cd efflux system membrane fusion protein n=1 Tax=Geofilum rubicundum JCM 15548 TaxID=1236989 RepID=A0A0E9LRS8_9BACT|nr:efflux RND transporter periplasmic adaptor subunit [Geofilum rubicundum]GAO28302.1 probable Co/Zn/Cd efflux system membrane fusion protein [Geofilum rubicundum JCM 15548]